MPTGITAPIYEGEDISLRDFLMRVGRLFGVAVQQRDDPLSDPVAQPEQSNRFRKYLSEAHVELADLKQMSEDECVLAAKAEHDKQLKQHNERIAESKIMAERYDKMIAKVLRWVPAEGQENVKKQALDQLEQSRKFDTFSDEQAERWAPGPLVSGQEWRQIRVEYIEANIARWRVEADELDEANATAVKWVEDFYASLPA
jgi:hypothetical protein